MIFIYMGKNLRIVLTHQLIGCTAKLDLFEIKYVRTLIEALGKRLDRRLYLIFTNDKYHQMHQISLFVDFKACKSKIFLNGP